MPSTLSARAIACSLLSLSFGLVLGSPIESRQEQQDLSQQKLEWSHDLCTEFVTTATSTSRPGSEFECAWLTVPLDYADAGVGRTRIALIRALGANAATRKGTIVINPGGPGSSGIDFLSGSLSRLRADYGGDWDIVSYAPRGVSPSGPENLFTLAVVRSYYESNRGSYGPGSVGSIGNLTTDADANFLLSQAAAIDSQMRGFDSTLVSMTAGKLKYIGTTAVARDVALIFDVLDGVGSPMNMHGFSYGTITTMQIIQLFTSRIGKAIVDGVSDPRSWGRQGPSDHPVNSKIADTDAVFRGFARVCAAAGPQNCSVARAGDNEDTLLVRIIAGLDELHQRYDDSNDVSFVAATAWIFRYLYHSSSWDKLDRYLARNVPGLRTTSTATSSKFVQLDTETEPLLPPMPPIWDPLGRRQEMSAAWADYRESLSRIAIRCGDAVDGSPNEKATTSTEEVFQELIRSAREVSTTFAASYGYAYYCHTWTTGAVERYLGPWDAKPKTPVLVVDTELDPTTPFKAAQLIASDKYLGSSARLIKLWNYGHTSYSVSSKCFSDIVFKYFNEDAVPEDKLNNEEDVLCSTETSILGTDPGTHWVRAEEIDRPDYDSEDNSPPAEAGSEQPSQPGQPSQEEQDAARRTLAHTHFIGTVAFVLAIGLL